MRMRKLAHLRTEYFVCMRALAKTAVHSTFVCVSTCEADAERDETATKSKLFWPV